MAGQPDLQDPEGHLTPVIARFDDMATNYAALVWDVVLPMDQIDEPLLFEFYARNGEQLNPEPQCAKPTPTPGPATPTPAPTATPAGFTGSVAGRFAGTREHRDGSARRDHGAVARRPARIP